jgi:hypothetical protein
MKRTKHRSYQLHFYMHDSDFCVHGAFQETSESSPKVVSTPAFIYTLYARRTLPPAPTPVIRPRRPINDDADILNGLEGKDGLVTHHSEAIP